MPIVATHLDMASFAMYSIIIAVPTTLLFLIMPGILISLVSLMPINGALMGSLIWSWRALRHSPPP
jgi:energy-converting hydrogenase Eha subunit G